MEAILQVCDPLAVWSRPMMETKSTPYLSNDGFPIFLAYIKSLPLAKEKKTE